MDSAYNPLLRCGKCQRDTRHRYLGWRWEIVEGNRVWWACVKCGTERVYGAGIGLAHMKGKMPPQFREYLDRKRVS